MTTAQRSKFPGATSPQNGTLSIPPVIEEALRQGGTLAISVSGGKDSQALLNELTRWFRAAQFSGDMFAIHADLGRAEWPETPGHVQAICDAVAVPLVVVRRQRGDLVARFEERLETLAGSGKPFWSSPQNRYCTSHLKTGPIDKELRKPFWSSSANRYCTSDLKRDPIDSVLRDTSIVISAEGVRGNESAARARKPVIEMRSRITSSSKKREISLADMEPAEALASRQEGQRVALTWRPLFTYTEPQIWGTACGTSEEELKRRRALYKLGAKEEALAGWRCHPAYVYGNARLSCALCILATASDLKNGAEHNPELYRHYLELERRGGATFKHGWSLADLDVEGEAARIRDEFITGAEPRPEPADAV